MDAAELGRLFDWHAAGLVLYARQMLGAEWGSLAEDVVQEVFVRLAGQREVPGNARAWLIRAVRNGVLDVRKTSRRRAARERETGMKLFREGWTEPAGMDAAEAQAGLMALPVEEREVLTLRLWNGATFEEIGEVMGMPVSTVHHRYQSGLERLRARWESPCRKK